MYAPGIYGLVKITVIIGIFAVPIVLVLAAVGYAVKSMRQGKETGAEEAKLIQDLHQGITRMEQRIEVLETILLEREPKTGSGAGE